MRRDAGGRGEDGRTEGRNGSTAGENGRRTGRMNRRCGRKGIVIARRTVTGLVEPQEVVVRARHLVLRGRPRRRDELPELRERDLIAPVLVRLEPQAIEDRALVRVRGVVPSHVVAVQAVPELLIRQVSVPVRVEREDCLLYTSPSPRD